MKRIIATAIVLAVSLTGCRIIPEDMQAVAGNKDDVIFTQSGQPVTLRDLVPYIAQSKTLYEEATGTTDWAKEAETEDVLTEEITSLEMASKMDACYDLQSVLVLNKIGERQSITCNFDDEMILEEAHRIRSMIPKELVVAFSLDIDFLKEVAKRDLTAKSVYSEVTEEAVSLINKEDYKMSSYRVQYVATTEYDEETNTLVDLSDEEKAKAKKKAKALAAGDNSEGAEESIVNFSMKDLEAISPEVKDVVSGLDIGEHTDAILLVDGYYVFELIELENREMSESAYNSALEEAREELYNGLVDSMDEEFTLKDADINQESLRQLSFSLWDKYSAGKEIENETSEQ